MAKRTKEMKKQPNHEYRLESSKNVVQRNIAAHLIKQNKPFTYQEYGVKDVLVKDEQTVGFIPSSIVQEVN